MTDWEGPEVHVLGINERPDPVFHVMETLMFWGSCFAVGAVGGFWIIVLGHWLA